MAPGSDGGGYGERNVCRLGKVTGNDPSGLIRILRHPLLSSCHHPARTRRAPGCPCSVADPSSLGDHLYRSALSMRWTLDVLWLNAQTVFLFTATGRMSSPRSLKTLFANWNHTPGDPAFMLEIATLACGKGAG